MDELLFSSTRNFLRSGDATLRDLTSFEYDQLINDSEDINLLNTFQNYLQVVHQWKEELSEQNREEQDEEDNEVVMTKPYLPMNVPHHYKNEEVFIEQFSLCKTEVSLALSEILTILCDGVSLVNTNEAYQVHRSKLKQTLVPKSTLFQGLRRCIQKNGNPIRFSRKERE